MNCHDSTNLNGQVWCQIVPFNNKYMMMVVFGLHLTERNRSRLENNFDVSLNFFYIFNQFFATLRAQIDLLRFVGCF